LGPGVKLQLRRLPAILVDVRNETYTDAINDIIRQSHSEFEALVRGLGRKRLEA